MFNAILTVINADTVLDKDTNMTALMAASENSTDPNLFKQILATSKNIDAQETTGSTALFYAVKANHQVNVDLLLKAGANPNKENINGVKPILLAYHKGFKNIVTRLKEAGASFPFGSNTQLTSGQEKEKNDNNKSSSSSSASSFSFNKKTSNAKNNKFHPRRHEFLKKLKAGDKTKSNIANEVFLVACQNDDEEFVNLFLKNTQYKNVDVLDNNLGVTTPCLFLACMAGHTQVVKALIKSQKCPIDTIDKNSGMTALCASSKNDNIEVLALLLEAGANIDFQDNGISPLMIATLSNQPATVKYLLTNNIKKANCALTNEAGFTALDYANSLTALKEPEKNKKIKRLLKQHLSRTNNKQSKETSTSNNQYDKKIAQENYNVIENNSSSTNSSSSSSSRNSVSSFVSVEAASSPLKKKITFHEKITEEQVKKRLTDLKKEFEIINKENENKKDSDKDFDQYHEIVNQYLNLCKDLQKKSNGGFLIQGETRTKAFKEYDDALFAQRKIFLAKYNIYKKKK